MKLASGNSPLFSAQRPAFGAETTAARSVSRPQNDVFVKFGYDPEKAAQPSPAEPRYEKPGFFSWKGAGLKLLGGGTLLASGVAIKLLGIATVIGAPILLPIGLGAAAVGGGLMLWGGYQAFSKGKLIEEPAPSEAKTNPAEQAAAAAPAEEAQEPENDEEQNDTIEEIPTPATTAAPKAPAPSGQTQTKPEPPAQAATAAPEVSPAQPVAPTQSQTVNPELTLPDFEQLLKAVQENDVEKAASAFAAQWNQHPALGEFIENAGLYAEGSQRLLQQAKRYLNAPLPAKKPRSSNPEALIQQAGDHQRTFTELDQLWKNFHENQRMTEQSWNALHELKGLPTMTPAQAQQFIDFKNALHAQLDSSKKHPNLRESLSQKKKQVDERFAEWRPTIEQIRRANLTAKQVQAEASKQGPEQPTTTA